MILKTNIKTWMAGLLAAAAASLCCITPGLAILGSLGGFASSFSWIEPFRPYLIGLTIIVFAFAWYGKLKPVKVEDCACERLEKKSFFQSKSFLVIVTLIAALLMTFPLYAKIFYPKPQKIAVIPAAKKNIEQAVFKIEGMTCEACTQHVNNEVSKINGVIELQTSYDSANSIVKFDAGKTNADSIAAAINSTGYKVISSTLTIK